MSIKLLRNIIKVHAQLHTDELPTLEALIDDKKAEELIKVLGLEEITDNLEVLNKSLIEVEYIKENKLSAEEIAERYTKPVNKEIAKEIGAEHKSGAKEIEIATAIFNKINKG